MAVRFSWTPQQIGLMDPAFIEELSAYLRAEDKYEESERKKSATT